MDSEKPFVLTLDILFFQNYHVQEYFYLQIIFHLILAVQAKLLLLQGLIFRIRILLLMHKFLPLLLKEKRHLLRQQGHLFVFLSCCIQQLNFLFLVNYPRIYFTTVLFMIKSSKRIRSFQCLMFL